MIFFNIYQICIFGGINAGNITRLIWFQTLFRFNANKISEMMRSLICVDL